LGKKLRASATLNYWNWNYFLLLCGPFGRLTNKEVKKKKNAAKPDPPPRRAEGGQTPHVGSGSEPIGSDQSTTNFAQGNPILRAPWGEPTSTDRLHAHRRETTGGRQCCEKAKVAEAKSVDHGGLEPGLGLMMPTPRGGGEKGQTSSGQKGSWMIPPYRLPLKSLI